MVPVIAVICAVNTGLLFGILGALTSPNTWLFIALVGILVGLGFGIFLGGR